MMLFASWIKHPFNVPVQRPQDANPRVHERPATLGRHDQAHDRRLPFRQVLLGLRQTRDVVGRVPERDELATARQRDWIIERFGPRHRAIFGGHASFQHAGA